MSGAGAADRAWDPRGAQWGVTWGGSALGDKAQHRVRPPWPEVSRLGVRLLVGLQGMKLSGCEPLRQGAPSSVSPFY